MNEYEKIELSIATLEQQRNILGNEAVDKVLDGLRKQLAGYPRMENLQAASPVTVMGAERKLVTIVFADISGFTALSERLDPEKVRDIINACFNSLVPVIEKYGGVVDKFIGDMIMSLFGAPTAHENDAERALRAALEMMQELAGFNTRYNTGLGMHIGINTGLVVAGGLGSEGRQHYSVMGDAVNLASRLEDASKDGEILVGPHTHNLTASLFVFEKLPPVHVKGKAEAVQVYRLTGLKSASGMNPRIPSPRSPFFGRDAELTLLRTTMQDLKSGKGNVIAISGEPGLGKSRLIAEVRRAAGTEPTGIQWAVGHTQSYTEGMSYWVVRSMIDSLVGLSPEMSTAEAGEALWRKVSELSGIQAAEVYPYLARLREVPLNADMEAHIRNVLPEALQRRMLRSFGDLVRAICRERPLVMVWEDLHWADPSSLNLLESLFPLADQVPVLFLLTFRCDEGQVEGWHKRIRNERVNGKHLVIELSPLTVHDSTRLIDSLPGIKDLPNGTRRMILDRSGGNPFFLEELHNAVREVGCGLAGKETAGLAAETGNQNVPDTLHGVIAARIDRLPPGEKHILQTASVFGRVFKQLVLGRLLDYEQADLNLDHALADLQYRELVRWHGAWEYTFKHAVTQEVSYNSLLITRRKELHRLAAVVMETVYPGQLAELSATLAYHYARADEPGKAIHYLLQAAERARKTYSNAEAITFYQAVLQQAGLLQQDVTQTVHLNERKVQLYEGLGTVYALTGRFDEARGAYREALALVPEQDRVLQSCLHRKIGNTWISQRIPKEALAAYDLAEIALGPVQLAQGPNWLEESFEIALDRMEAYYFSQSSIDQMQELARSIAPTIRQSGTSLQCAKYFSNLLKLALLRNRYLVSDETLEYAITAQAWSMEADHKKLIIVTTFQVGFCRMVRGEFKKAEAELLEALRKAEQIGDREDMVMILAWLTVTYRRSGDSEKARPYAKRSMEVASPGDIPVYCGIARANHAWLAWLDGNHAEAQASALAAMELFVHHRPVVFFATWLMTSPLMDIALKQGNEALAIHYARELIHPGHMHMDHALEELLAHAVRAWDEQEAGKAQALLQQSIGLLQQTGWM